MEVPPPPPPFEPPGVHINRPSSPRPKVDLSTTSLILIALIVGVCTGSGNRSQKSEFKDLTARITRLETKIDALTKAPRSNCPPPATALPTAAPSTSADSPAR